MSMMLISAKQMKAGRALLGWAQSNLADKTGFSVTTIRNLESGEMSVRGTTMHIIRQAMESAGIEFLDGDGVRCRNDKIRIFQGIGSCGTFLEDMIRVVGTKGGNVEIIIPSYDDLLRACGLMADDKIMPLTEISHIATIKCLLCEKPSPSTHLPPFEFRLMSREKILPFPYLIYEDRCGVIILDDPSTPNFVSISAVGGVRNCQRYFRTHWETAQPLYNAPVLNRYAVAV